MFGVLGVRGGVGFEVLGVRVCYRVSHLTYLTPETSHLTPKL